MGGKAQAAFGWRHERPEGGGRQAASILQIAYVPPPDVRWPPGNGEDDGGPSTDAGRFRGRLQEQSSGNERQRRAETRVYSH